MPLPATATATPVGQKGPRAAILVELKRATQLTALELAGKLRASMNAIRHHLKELEAEQLVEYDRVRHGVGAPVFAYRLSAAGEALFPRRYEEILLRVLDHVVEREGRQAAVSVLESRYRDLARELGPQMAGATSTGRLEMVSRALGEAGYMAEWEGMEDGERGTLTEHNCAIRSVAQRFPEVCDAEARFIEDMLGAEVERRSHILAGCSACEYSVRFGKNTAHGRDE